ncbi:MAG: hypothetical protein LBB98_04280, partial [Treponema sp.]|nr:hypothetical protein [Treponema sp.]
MKKSKFLIAGMAALALSFGSVLAGCDNGTPSDGDPQTISISEVQLYTTTGNAYPGSGTVQTVTGTVFQSFSVPVGGSPAEQEPEYNFHDGSGQGHSIGTIGSISADGKLTLTLGELSDADLFDAGMDGVKYGMLVTSPGLLFAKSHEDDLVLVYINKDYTIDGQSVKKGWDFGGNTDTSGYKWVIDTAAKNGTPNVINGYWGVTNDGKNIEIVVTPSVSSSVARAANWST